MAIDVYMGWRTDMIRTELDILGQWPLLLKCRCYYLKRKCGGICVKTRLDWTWSPLRPVWCKQSSPVSWSAPTDSSLKRIPRRSPSPPSPWIREQKAADCCCKKRAETEIENGSSWFHRWSPPDNLCGSNFIAKFIPPSLRFDPFHHPSHSFGFFFNCWKENAARGIHHPSQKSKWSLQD